MCLLLWMCLLLRAHGILGAISACISAPGMECSHGAPLHNPRLLFNSLYLTGSPRGYRVKVGDRHFPLKIRRVLKKCSVVRVTPNKGIPTEPPDDLGVRMIHTRPSEWSTLCTYRMERTCSHPLHILGWGNIFKVGGITAPLLGSPSAIQHLGSLCPGSPQWGEPRPEAGVHART